MSKTVIDTRERAPFAWGRFVFRFKWAEHDRCTFVYIARHSGRIYRITGEIRHSLAGRFRGEWESGKLNPESPFIWYSFADEPRAIEAWQHICRAAVEREKESEND